MLFFGSNLWKSLKAKYAFKLVWKQRDYNCIDSGHGKAGWLKTFHRDMMADQWHSTAAVLPTSLMEGGFGILTLSISIAPQTACPFLDAAHVGTTSSCWAPFSICQVCAWAAQQAISLMEWHLGQTLSPQKRLTHEDTRNVNLLGKIPKHHKGRDIPLEKENKKKIK